jgi:hypothetical protein
MNQIESTVSIVIDQQYLDSCMRIRCRGDSFTEHLPSYSPVIADVFTGRYQATAAVHRVTAQQRVYFLRSGGWNQGPLDTAAT